MSLNKNEKVAPAPPEEPEEKRRRGQKNVG